MAHLMCGVTSKRSSKPSARTAEGASGEIWRRTVVGSREPQASESGRSNRRPHFARAPCSGADAMADDRRGMWSQGEAFENPCLSVLLILETLGRHCHSWKYSVLSDILPLLDEHRTRPDARLEMLWAYRADDYAAFD